MNNTWNKRIYKLWSPVYDRLFNSRSFRRARIQVFQELPFQKGQRILFVGVGTGADFAHIPFAHLQVTAIDISPEMLRQAEAKFAGAGITFQEMDAQSMSFEQETFDWVVASLVLSVVPDAKSCLEEMLRVLKQDGTLLIFDKFAGTEQPLPFWKRCLRPVIQLLGTDIGLRFEDLHSRQQAHAALVEDKPVMWRGMYRRIVLRKTGSITASR